MSDPLPPLDLAEKIARLVEEKGWNQEDFANISGLNRQTIRQILQPTGERSLRNSTVAACARALGLTVNELRATSLERLLARMNGRLPFDADDRTHRLLELAEMPELKAWIERNPERSRALTPEEAQELLGQQGPNGALASYGTEFVVAHIERRRELLDKVRALAASEHLAFLEQFVDLLHEKIQPRRSL